MAWLIDVTDERFKIPVNRDAIEFIRRANPFAHSDVGAKLIENSRRFPNSNYYCPSFNACAYVALHNAANVIFAIAFGMSKIAYRLPQDKIGAALANSTAEPSEVGIDWLNVNPFSRSESVEIVNARLLQFCESALRHADSLLSFPG